MNWELIFTIFVSLLGHVHATDGSERECQDLKNMRTQLEKAFKLVPDSNVKCKPNSNCTGLACYGKVKGKRFKGTVILEGCHDPVRMLIYFNKRRMNVTNGFDKQVSSKPVPIRVNVGLVKKGDTVSVTLTIKICLIGKVCFPYRILNNQKIRVHCNDSAGPKISPSQNPWPFSRNSNLAGKGHSLSSAGIAGVVVAVIIFFVILIAIIVWIVHGKRKRAARYNDLAMNDDTDPLVFDSAPIA